ncbi:MAG: hypothetical protein J7496_06795 [Novosphingobium sp.]|nr:hypothetical protein [Novosphingobium sp.]MBO9602199.1 hypothetical protein [Novosphingobium sp.]
MFHGLFEEGDWSVPKRYGYGAGLPIAWRGWAVLGMYLAIVFATTLAPLAGVAVLIIAMTVLVLATCWLVVIAQRHARGGWRWRWGED